MNPLRAPAGDLPFALSPRLRAALALALAVVLVLFGWLVSAHSVVALAALVFAAVFAAIVLIEDSVLYALPFVLILPNLGVMIPGLYAVLIWDAFTVGFFGGVIARRVLTGRAVVTIDPWFRRLLFLFVAIAAASLIQGVLAGAGVFMKGLKEVIRLVELTLFLVALASELTSEDRVLVLARNVVVAGVVSLVIALSCYVWFPDFIHQLMTLKRVYVLLGTYRLRMVSTAGDVAETAQFFLMMLGIAGYFAFRGAARARPLGLLAAGGFLVAVFLTYNKGTWLALLVGMGIAIVRGGSRHRGPAVLAVVLVLAAVLLLFQVRDEENVDILASDLAHVTRSSGLIRIQRWFALQNVLTRHPLLGVGYNTFAYIYGEYSTEPGAGRPYGHPHNLFADILAGTGLVGFSAFMMMGLRLARLARRNTAEAPTPRLRDLSFTLYVVLWFFLAGNMATSYLFKPEHPAFLMAMVAAMILAIHRLALAAGPPAPDTPPASGRLRGTRPVAPERPSPAAGSGR